MTFLTYSTLPGSNLMHAPSGDGGQSDDDAVVGKWVRHHRRLARMTQTDLAREVDKTQATVSRWENGQEAIRSADINAMRDIFTGRGVNVAPLYDEARSTRETSQLAGAIINGGEIRPVSAHEQVEHLRVNAPGMRGKLAYRVETSGLGAAMLGWYLFTDQRREGQPYDDAIGTMSVVTCAGGDRYLGVVRRSRGEAEHIERVDAPTIFDAVILHAAPVLMAIPGPRKIDT